ncbi:TPA: hypothetical protein ACPYFY_002072 [Streptococcus pneumoniae]
MVRSLKTRLEKLEEYAGKTEYATTDECISLYVDCLRFAFQQDEIRIDMDDFIKTPFKDIKLADYKKSKKRMDELREMTGISEFSELDQ